MDQVVELFLIERSLKSFIPSVGADCQETLNVAYSHSLSDFFFFSALDDWSSKKSSRTAKYLALHEQLPTKLLAFNFLLRLCCSINDPQAHSEVTYSLRVYPKYRKTAIKSKQANVLNQTRDLQQVNRQWANCVSQRQSRKKKWLFKLSNKLQVCSRMSKPVILRGSQLNRKWPSEEAWLTFSGLST